MAKEMVTNLSRANRTERAAQRARASDISARRTPESRQPERQTQASRPEVEQEAAKRNEQAVRQAQSQARGLNQLAARGRALQPAQQAATPQAVVARPDIQPGNNSTLPNQQQQAPNFVQPQNPNPVPNQGAPQARPQPQVNRPATPQPRSAEQPRLPQEARQPDASRAAEFASRFVQPQPQVRGESAEPRDVRRGQDSEKDGSDRSSSRSSRTSRGGAVYQSEAGGNLGRVLDGGVGADAGGDTSEEGGSDAALARPVFVRDIPQEDESLIIFNEPNPGLETVLAKRNILEQHVIQRVEHRLQEIRELNDRLGDRIRETLPLSERIVGEAKGLLRAADFIRDVNGGVSA
ncbi:MAG: hypothetical protein KJ957_08530 [Candidatus Omnitrophica bacterium]|nr:hypothetical protein [Candidatus Omnitrophota bacterium]